jgi:hypothetical protein
LGGQCRTLEAMAKKKTEQENAAGTGETLKAAAVEIGTAIGKVVKKAKVALGKENPVKTGKFVKKNKKRLPRKDKKELKKKQLAAKG